ncbi:TRAP transporter substrate-binding protein [Uliginosibacterium sp. sgz301328]|uniref:TRAP transporter substrate-binding protein n=1 Tax=Uliginosibacterium sp. sgz301328 TaxID=3243764 RepID=UPI00359D8400
MRYAVPTLAVALCMAWSATTHAAQFKASDGHVKEDSTVRALQYMSDNVRKETSNDIRIKVFPNGTLGDEAQVLQLVQQGTIEMARVSVGMIKNFAPEFTVLSMPYLFRDMQHFKRFADSPIAADMLKSLEKSGFVGLTLYTNGFRSFYTRNKPILKPEDLSGLKIRVMSDPDSIEMVKLLKGQPTPMAISEVFSALQQGVLDGAESAVTVLTHGSHGEVTKAFSLDEHTLLPDIVVFSKKKWDTLNDKQKAAIMSNARKSLDVQNKLFIEDLVRARDTAEKKMGVKFYTVDKKPFSDLVQPMYQKLPPAQVDIVNKIRAL